MNLNEWAYNEVARKARNEKRNEIHEILQTAIDKRYEEIYEIEDWIKSLDDDDFDIIEMKHNASKYRIRFRL